MRAQLECIPGVIQIKSDLVLPKRQPVDSHVLERSAGTPEGGPPAPSKPSLAGVRVLVVDDEPDARDLATVTLGACGAEVFATSSADAALREVARFRPDVVVSDIGMPDVDGYQLVRALRALPPSEGGRTPAIALTAYAGEGDRALALEAGFQLHVAKPVNPDGLVAAIAQLVRSHEADSQG